MTTFIIIAIFVACFAAVLTGEWPIVFGTTMFAFGLVIGLLLANEIDKKADRNG